MRKWKWIAGVASVMLVSILVFFGWNVIYSKHMVGKSITNYLEWFYQIDQHMLNNDFDINEVIATVGSEDITKKELYSAAAALSAQKLEFGNDTTYTPHQIEQIFLDNAYEILILESLFICYSKIQHIQIDKQDALDYQQRFTEHELESDAVNIRAEAIVKHNYPGLYEKEAFGYQALQELVEKKLANTGNRTPDKVNKAHEEVIKMAHAAFPVEKNYY